MLTGLEPYETKIAHDLERERSRKAATPKPLAAGAKNESESRVLISLRASPATSEAALAKDAKLNDLATMLAVRALTDRGLVRRVTNTIGATNIVATK